MKRVALVGTAPETGHLAPFGDPDVDIWSLNDAYRRPWLVRYDRWFQVHQRWMWQPPYFQPEDVDWLRHCGVPVYTIEVEPDIPTSVAFPLDEVSAGFRRFFTSTVAYMAALAIYEGYDEIGLYGVQMSANSEYADYAPSVSYWLGVAEAQGRRVVLPEQCPLLKGPLYGREESGVQRLDPNSFRYQGDLLAALYAPEHNALKAGVGR